MAALTVVGTAKRVSHSPHVIGLPSGIGDCMWALNKLKHAGPQHYRIADGWPYRTVPYLQLLGPDIVASAEYGDFGYQDLVAFGTLHVQPGTTWASLDGQQWGQLLLEPNRHLEAGKPLADWLPDLPTDYHLPMHTSDEDARKAAQLLRGLKRPLWGVSAASYRGSKSWHTWGREAWLRFLRRFHAEAGGTIVLMGGAWDDLTQALAPDVAVINVTGAPLRRLVWQCRGKPNRHDTCGKTTVGGMVEVLKHLTGYIGFSSGQGMLNCAMWGKTFLLWPTHQLELSQSWADPAMLDAGTYATSLWNDPDDVFPLVTSWLRRPDHPERRQFQR